MTFYPEIIFLSRDNFLSRDTVYNSVYILPENLCGLLLTGFSQVEGLWWRKPSLLVKSRDIADRIKIVISRVVNKTRTRGRGRGRGLFFFLFKECCFLAFYRLRSMAVLSDALLSGEAAKACPKRTRSVHERAAKPQVLTVSLPSPTFPLRARPKPPCYAGYAIHISSVFFIKMNCSGAHFMQSSPSNYRNIYQRQFNFGIRESDKATLIHL